MKLLFLGFGIENKSLATSSQVNLLTPTVMHLNEDASNLIGKTVDGVEHVKFSLNEAKQFAPDYVIRSPGISIYSEEVQQLLNEDFIVTTATGLWLKLNENYTTIGITGTKGKSSTANFLYKLLKNDAELAGNIGEPIWNIKLTSSTCKYVILELSSFMTSDLLVSTDYAALTSLSPEHIDWHRNEEQYFKDKLNLFTLKNNAGQLPYNFIPNKLVDVVEEHQITVDQTIQNIPDKHNELFSFLPEHIAYDLFLAINIYKKLIQGNVSDELLNEVLKNYIPLKGRMRKIEGGTNTWIDDSLSSNPFGASAAVKTFSNDNLVLIVGGESRGVKLSELQEVLSQRQKPTFVVGISNCGNQYIDELQVQNNSVYIKDLDQAVKYIHNNFSNYVVLFSPAAPTPKEEGNWSTRSDLFEDTVSTLADKSVS